ncbi:MAG: prolipoprotein diacylglyceryl transferase [Candidatus Pelagibacter sp.]|nr:prolipoprotein diacylglyceryl transferase [Candidatus Pelagibacter sp.]OUW24554.1 MAG: prolipoprotein diacylglyceryl transferase [Rickettsiales bacterium TMED174]
MFVHNLDPILLDLGIISIRWYSIAYVLGIILGWWYGKKIIFKLKKKQNIDVSAENFDDLITYLIISIIVGGRLGYVIFYNPYFYLTNPFDIIKVWQGGMSFHGGLLGVITATYYFCKKNNLNLFVLLDVISCVAPIGIFFGRVANFINAELYGKVTNVSWGVIFPQVDELKRHPSQLYEALLEGLILFYILNLMVNSKKYMTSNCSSTFLILYGFFRIFSEIFREPDRHLGYIFNSISMGSILSMLMIILGVVIFYRKNEIQS